MHPGPVHGLLPMPYTAPRNPPLGVRVRHGQPFVPFPAKKLSPRKVTEQSVSPVKSNPLPPMAAWDPVSVC